jgi:ABC-2 type transport system permease protein
MLETVRYEVEGRLRGSLALSVLIAILGAFYVAMWPSFADVDLDQFLEAWPPALRELFGVESLASIEGFLATELYQFVWVLLLGLYVAYSAAGLIAGDVERGRMDLLLSLPVTRTRLLLEKFASLLAPVLLVNLVVPVVVLGSVLAIGETIDRPALVAVHVLSVPYLLACGAIGLVLSVLVDRADVANRLALGVVFGLFLVQSVTAVTEGYEWLGQVSPTAYYDPTAILVHNEYDLVGAAVLLAATVVLVAVAAVLFRRKDLDG